MSDDPEQKHQKPISRERFLSVLNDITFAALETRDFAELLQLLADRLAEIIDADGCFITLWDESTNSASPGAAYGPLRNLYKDVIPKPGEPTITAAVLKANKPLVIQDPGNSKYASNRITRQFPTKSMLGLPLLQGQKKLGAVLFSFHQRHEFTEQEIDYCEQAVRQISLAITNVKNLNALEQSEEKYRLAAEALKVREAHLAKAQANARMGSWENDLQLGKPVWSDTLFQLFDVPTPAEVPEDDELIKLVAKGHRKHFSDTLFAAVETGELKALDFKTIHGRHLAGEIFIDSELNKVYGTLQDVTAQRKLESELLQARKMEAVGTLAGGIAHNFNNILTVIMGNYEILKSSTLEGSPERKVLDQCLDAADRAAVLTRQLMVVSRKHDMTPADLNLNTLISDLVDLLKPLIGDHITITTDLHSELGIVHADPGHLEQVIMNLTLNARDALNSGGTINIHTENIQEDDVLWSTICVRDNGTGIDPAAIPHIFEPFYTTKEVGQGTGLGLATVASIVEQSHGKIEVDSQPGEGTSITIFLPAHEASAEFTEKQQPQNHPTSKPKTAVILLVEDHESLRNIAQFVLDKAGYQMLVAEDGVEAKELVLNSAQPDLLLTDIQLPSGISGIQLADEFRQNWRDLPVIFMSGMRDIPIELEYSHFLPKPFRPNDLLAAVEKALAPKNPSSGSRY